MLLHVVPHHMCERRNSLPLSVSGSSGIVLQFHFWLSIWHDLRPMCASICTPLCLLCSGRVGVQVLLLRKGRRMCMCRPTREFFLGRGGAGNLSIHRKL